jgi:hypothetical protein
MALCVIWDIIGLGLVILSVLIIAQPTLFWSSASRNVYHVLCIGIITAIMASFGFAGARSNGPTLKICFYFYIVICVLVASIVLAASAFWLRILLETIFESAWDDLRVQFPTDMTSMNSKMALEFMWEQINEHIYIVLPTIIFIWLSIFLGIIMSGIVLTCKNITGTFGFFANILLVGIGVGFLFLGTFISQVLSLTAKLWLYSIPALLPGISMLTVGVMGMLHLAPCVKTRGKICIMYIHLGLAGLGTIAMIALGIYFMMQSSEIGDRIRDLDDKEMGSMLQALNAGGTWDVESTKQLMSDGSQTYGIICIVVSALVIVTMITGGQVLHKTKRDFQDRETERAGQRMALSCRYQADEQQEWMSQDVEVIPEMRGMPQSQPGQEIQMANLGAMQMPVAQQPIPQAVPVAQHASPPMANAYYAGDRI